MGIVQLIIQDGCEADAGEYFCKIENQEAETKTKVKVSEIPAKFIKQLKSGLGTEKESMVLECEVDEEDAPVVWKKDGEVLKPDKRYTFLSSRLQFFLSLFLFNIFAVFLCLSEYFYFYFLLLFF